MLSSAQLLSGLEGGIVSVLSCCFLEVTLNSGTRFFLGQEYSHDLARQVHPLALEG